MKNFKSLIEFQREFSTDAKCRKHLELLRWNGTPTCPFCQGTSVKRLTGGKRFQCNVKECRKQFSVTVGTVCENTKIPLTKWFAAMYILLNHKKGISSCQLARDLDVTQKTAWFLAHRVRAMVAEQAPELLDSLVEIDETYVGGKRANKHAKQREQLMKQYGTGYNEKIPVIGMLQRDGRVFAQRVKVADGITLKPIIKARVKPGTIIMTDGHGAYRGLNKHFDHVEVNHAQGEYVRGQYHTNGIENYWSILKRGIIGIYHHVSPKHLNRYCVEFSYRFNERDLTQDERFNLAVSRLANARLTYNTLISDLPHHQAKA